MSDQIPAGVARIVKTKRMTHTVTADDVTAEGFYIDVPWDAAFADLNYTCDQNVEVVAPADSINYFVGGFTKAVDKVTVYVGVGGNAGDVVIVHSHGMRD